jgi:hypothetical protein
MNLAIDDPNPSPAASDVPASTIAGGCASAAVPDDTARSDAGPDEDEDEDEDDEAEDGDGDRDEHEHEHEHVGDHADEPCASSLPHPPPDFKPFFALVEDPLTGEHHHPTVHYVFADDDPDLLTNAALHTLPTDHDADRPELAGLDRFVIVDVDATGKEIVSASSLAPDWQVAETKVVQAPSWRDESTAESRQLMVWISGHEPARGDVLLRDAARRRDDVGGLLRAFDDHLAGLEDILLDGGGGCTPARSGVAAPEHT